MQILPKTLPNRSNEFPHSPIAEMHLNTHKTTRMFDKREISQRTSVPGRRTNTDEINCVQTFLI